MCHWLDPVFDFKSVILDFKHFLPPHSAVATEELIMQTLQFWNIESRVRAITTDNASEMEPAIDGVCSHLNATFQLGLHKDFHVRCACHVINIAAVAASKVFLPNVEKL